MPLVIVGILGGQALGNNMSELSMDVNNCWYGYSHVRTDLVVTYVFRLCCKLSHNVT